MVENNDLIVNNTHIYTCCTHKHPQWFTEHFTVIGHRNAGGNHMSTTSYNEYYNNIVIPRYIQYIHIIMNELQDTSVH